MPQTANHIKASSPLWFAGICDDLLAKVAIWNQAYWYGEIHSTRKWLDPKTGQVVDKPTRMAHWIPFKELELDHLIRIVGILRPGSDLVRELEDVKKVWKYGKPVQGYRYMRSYWSKVNLPQGLHRVIVMCFYPEHVKDILAMLVEAKTGQKSSALDTAVEAAKQAGKDLFEE